MTHAYATTGERRNGGKKKEQQPRQGRRGDGQAQGRAKEAAGAVTGDEATKSEGRSDQTKGTAKEKKGKLKDLFK